MQHWRFSPNLLRALSVLALASVLAIPPSGQFTTASSHREAPLISQDPSADITDMYVFRSPDAPDTITAIMNVWPFALPEGGPNWYRFDENVRYSMHVTQDGGNTEDLRLDFRYWTEIRSGETFLLTTGPVNSLNDSNLNARQFYSVDLVLPDGTSNRLVERAPVAPPNVGPRAFPNYEAVAMEAVTAIPGVPGGRVFAGPRDDPFFVDLASTFDLLNIRPGPPGNLGGGVDNLAGYNVLSIAVQLPIAAVVRSHCNMDPTNMDCVVGMWVTTSRPRTLVLNGEAAPTASGEWVQVSRLSAALVNEVVVPLAFKDVFNASQPQNDAPRFLGPVVDPEAAKLLNALYGLNVPPAPRDDLVTIFLTGIPGLNQPPDVQGAEIAHLNVAVPVSANPHRLGVLGGDTQGYPNGRRLGDDVVDISLQAVAGGTPFTPQYNVAPNNQLGDGVDGNDLPWLTTFPYLAHPHSGVTHNHHR